MVRGAAWVTPAVVAGTAAPAFAASPCTTSACPDLSFGTVAGTNAATAGNGWSYAATASPGSWSNTNPVGFQPSVVSGNDVMVGKGPHFAATAEPTTANRVLTLSQTGQPALASGCGYTISVGIVTYTSTSTPLVLNVMVGNTRVGQYSTQPEPAAGYTDRGTKTFSVPAAASGAVTFQFVFGAAGDHEDIKLYRPTITCT